MPWKLDHLLHSLELGSLCFQSQRVWAKLAYRAARSVKLTKNVQPDTVIIGQVDITITFNSLFVLISKKTQQT